VFYTLDDLDLTGDGDTEDLEDLVEDTLTLFRFDENMGRWTRLDPSLSWVFDVGVNTTDQLIYGIEYAGYVWATLSRSSTFAVAGSISFMEVDIDIQPGRMLNFVNLLSNGMMRVAILGSEDFDVRWIDLDSINIGGVGAWSHRSGKVLNMMMDVNRDGHKDLVVFFRTWDLARAKVLTFTTHHLTLEGTLDFAHGRIPFRGSDFIIV
jgi:hypothetical protein